MPSDNVQSIFSGRSSQRRRPKPGTMRSYADALFQVSSRDAMNAALDHTSLPARAESLSGEELSTTALTALHGLAIAYLSRAPRLYVREW